ncbi:MAG: dTDP-4-dehydrorhamnose 3,5-epimerase [candidate division Zixibacteria bacterium]|jgi:dTDP-4-dehydrorhamnose 3,5-epimerase|nr:dTDP-4-dehydrorhamnose 3,5-epimerase [candidate division Zixibacteria bacterium]
MKLIDGVIAKKLKVIPDERGRLAEILRADDPEFKKFGQVYFTTAYPGVVKAWHYHKIQTDYFSCIKGMTKLAMYDSRKDSPTFGLINEFIIGEHNPMLVVIPPNVYHGFKAIGESESVMLNIPTEPYNHQTPDEYRLDAHTKEIPYDWARKDG